MYLATFVQSGSIHLLVPSPSQSGTRPIDHSVLLNSVISRYVLLVIEPDKINEALGFPPWAMAISPLQTYSAIPTSPSTTRWRPLEFCPLRVQVLCEKEVILFVKADVHLFHSIYPQRDGFGSDQCLPCRQNTRTTFCWIDLLLPAYCTASVPSPALERKG